MEKKELYVRFANESTYYTKIRLDLKKVKNIRIFKDEVFFTIDDITVATTKDNWDKLK